MHFEQHKYYSHILGRDIDFTIHGHWGQPLLMFPTSMGNVHQNADFGMMDAIADLINEGKIKVYNVNSIDMDSFYADHMHPQYRIYNYDAYVRFLHTEFVPMIQEQTNSHRISVAGCSFGAYHASNFAFKYPDLIHGLIAMSGSFDIKNFMDGYYDDLVFFNNPKDFMPGAESWKYHHMKIVIGTSDWDVCRKFNVEMAALLDQKGIPYLYDEKKWIKHDWPLWRMAFPEYVRHIMY